MITIRLLGCLALIITLTACSLSNVATTSFRSSFDFSAVESYSTYGRNSAFGDLQNLRDSTRNTIELAIEQGFDESGFNYKILKKADIVIAYHIINHDFNELKSYNQQVKYCSYCLKAGQATRRELQAKLRPGSLILDIVDPKSQRSVWRSVYPLDFKEDDNSQEMQKKISDAVDSMLQDYPKGKSLSRIDHLNEQFV
jgi:hypothetical protein